MQRAHSSCVGSVMMLWCILSLLSILAGVAAAKTLKEEFAGGAISVGSDNIQTFFSESKNKFILEFYAPWCGHCERFGPSLDEIAREFHSVEDFYYVGKVDITNNDALAGRFDISHIPSLFLNSEEDKFYTYDGGQMTKSAVIEWVRRGHKQHVPINWLGSPMGPSGKMKGAFIESGVRLQTYAKSISEEYDLPPTWGLIILAALFGFLILIATLGFALVMVPTHDKDD